MATTRVRFNGGPLAGVTRVYPLPVRQSVEYDVAEDPLAPTRTFHRYQMATLTGGTVAATWLGLRGQ